MFMHLKEWMIPIDHKKTIMKSIMSKIAQQKTTKHGKPLACCGYQKNIINNKVFYVHPKHNQVFKFEDGILNYYGIVDEDNCFRMTTFPQKPTNHLQDVFDESRKTILFYHDNRKFHYNDLQLCESMAETHNVIVISPSVWTVQLDNVYFANILDKQVRFFLYRLNFEKIYINNMSFFRFLYHPDLKRTKITYLMHHQELDIFDQTTRNFIYNIDKIIYYSEDGFKKFKHLVEGALPKSKHTKPLPQYVKETYKDIPELMPSADGTNNDRPPFQLTKHTPKDDKKTLHTIPEEEEDHKFLPETDDYKEPVKKKVDIICYDLYLNDVCAFVANYSDNYDFTIIGFGDSVTVPQEYLKLVKMVGRNVEILDQILRRATTKPSVFFTGEVRDYTHYNIQLARKYKVKCYIPPYFSEFQNCMYCKYISFK